MSYKCLISTLCCQPDAAAPAPLGGYSQAIEVSETTRTLYISGQVPTDCEGNVPGTFTEQARLVWSNIGAQLQAADMGLENLVKVTIFLSDRKYGLENRKVRMDVIGNLEIANTVVIIGIFDEGWLLEIEAIAAA